MNASKGVVGLALLGPLGTVAGGADLGKREKSTLHCTECEAIWQQKL